MLYEVITGGCWQICRDGSCSFFNKGTWTPGKNYYLSRSVAGSQTTDKYVQYGEVQLFLGTGVETGFNIDIDVGVSYNFV